VAGKVSKERVEGKVADKKRLAGAASWHQNLKTR
jgi:hypothetical protein